MHRHRRRSARELVEQEGELLGGDVGDVGQRLLLWPRREGRGGLQEDPQGERRIDRGRGDSGPHHEAG